MLTGNELERINELARKSKSIGLSEEELNEQKLLRQEYLNNVRESFTNQLKTMTVIDPEGNDVTPEKVRSLQHNKNKH